MMNFLLTKINITMKKFLKFAILLLIIPAFVLTSCKDDDDDDPAPERQTDVEFQLLKDYLVDNDLDLDNILDGWIVPAATVNTNLNDYYVIDIRKADAFATSHIPGAVNSTFANVVIQAASAGANQTIVVVCYSGQSAGHAVCALRLSGHATAKVLKWGMSGWSSALDSWTGACKTLGHANWTGAPGAIVEHTKEYNDPDITETGTGEQILASRIEHLLNGSLRGVTGADVLAAPGSYFINNYWEATDVADHGNIAGAHRIKPLTLAGEEYIHLDPSKDVVTYCWTGQTSSVITAYLYVLGYNSHTLKNGSNSMIYDNLLSHKWAIPTTDLPLD